MEIIGEILHPNLEPSPHEPNRSNPFATHRHNLMAEDMLDACANARAAPVVGLLLRGQRLLARPFSVNLGAQSCGFEVGFDLCGSVGRVGSESPSGLRGQQHLFQDLTVMHRRIGDCIHYRISLCALSTFTWFLYP